MDFDHAFTQLLRRGDIASAKALLIKKYPHLTHIPHPKMLQREITEMKIKGSIKTNR
jgi:hypothetical protein